MVISVYGCHGERDWSQVGVFQVVSFWKINMYIYIWVASSYNMDLFGW